MGSPAAGLDAKCWGPRGEHSQHESVSFQSLKGKETVQQLKNFLKPSLRE
jgi:hypothetical protein